MGPEASLAGRNIGQDFTLKDGWRMYHGDVVPGFPQHPHRGFETITIVPQGLVDHSDSLGAAGRFGNGDVQWMTAGKGVLHAEMFPLLNRESENPLLLFQIWLNLPAKSKFVEPHFRMLWRDEIPKLIHKDDQGHTTEITVIAGEIDDVQAPEPTPNSWAAESENHVGIWLIKMEPEAQWNLPVTTELINRNLYFYQGDSISLNDESLKPEYGAVVDSQKAITVKNGNREGHLLLLQGKPINEPVAQHGPFVMNTQSEIMQAFQDYQRTQFGGWPWPANDHVHPREAGRFARHADGKEELK